MADRRKTYEDKNERPRKLYGVRLSPAEEAKATKLARGDETVQEVLRRLLKEKRVR